MLNKWIISKFRQHPSPAEQAASRIVSALFADLLPGLKSEYELLWQASDGQLKIALLDLQAETLIFALHCLDRAIFAHWGLSYRAVFIDFAVERARILFSDGLPAGLSDHEKYFLIKSFGDNYNSRQYEYSSMKLFPDGEDGGLKNVLAWEFGKRICLDAGVFNPEVISLMAQNAQSIFMMMTKIASAL